MRARRRHAIDDNVSTVPGGDTAGEDEDLLPGVLDPITLEPIVTPAISPAGHVMGLATWAAVLAEQGKCPFTQAPLRREQVCIPARHVMALEPRIATRKVLGYTMVELVCRHVCRNKFQSLFR